MHVKQSEAQQCVDRRCSEMSGSNAARVSINEKLLNTFPPEQALLRVMIVFRRVLRIASLIRRLRGMEILFQLSGRIDFKNYDTCVLQLTRVRAQP